jgi:hypothetical protein
MGSLKDSPKLSPNLNIALKWCEEEVFGFLKPGKSEHQD